MTGPRMPSGLSQQLCRAFPAVWLVLMGEAGSAVYEQPAVSKH